VTDSNSLDLQVVVFDLDQQIYGVPISSVLEIIRLEKITGLPQAPYFIEGIIEIRGRVIPVMDLRKRFGMQEAEHTQATRIIIVDMDNTTMGIIVDAVTEVLHISSGAIQPPPPVIDNVDRSFIHGVALMGERMIILLELDKVLHDKEKEVLESVLTAEQLA
jgi:purine-binding chemotaxis protein CheW